MDQSLDGEIYMGQQCQDMTQENGGEKTKRVLEEKREGFSRNPFVNVPFSPRRNKGLAKVSDKCRKVSCTNFLTIIKISFN